MDIEMIGTQLPEAIEQLKQVAGLPEKEPHRRLGQSGRHHRAAGLYAVATN